MLHKAQSGFRANHCTQDVLLKTVEDWRGSLERNEIVGSVFVDLSKAFDSINHCLLLQKLALYGFRDESLEWFRNYLSGRRQRVAYGDEMSEWVNVRMGVPQGSILGPLLFTIFVNDLPAALSRSKVMLYADETTVYFADPSAQRVEEVLTEDLGRLSCWIAQNGLRMNLQKTQFLSMSRRCREEEAKRLQVMVNEEALEMSEEVKYLGVTIDRQLSWRKHVDGIQKKCFSMLGLLFRVRRALPTELTKRLYLALVQPHLVYCAVVWAECSQVDARKLDSVQRRGMRMILDEKWDCSSAAMRSRLGWMTPVNRRRMMRMIVLRRCLSGRCPTYLRNLLRTNEDLGRRSTRRNKNLYLPVPKSNWLARSFTYRASQDWNQLPLEIRNASDQAFKGKISQFLMG